MTPRETRDAALVEGRRSNPVPVGDARQEWADELLDRLTPVMSALAVLFLLVVFAESMADPDSALADVLAISGWLLWGVFVAEFGFRIWIAPDTSAFLKKNWWQALFLVLPFLRILRLFWAFRILRTGRVLSSAVRSSRSARGLVGSRVGWLAVVSAVTILGSSQLLYEFGVYDAYGSALHAAALAAMTGEPLNQPDGFAQVLDVILAVFSVIVFATLAGTLGAYFLRDRQANSESQNREWLRPRPGGQGRDSSS